MFQLSDSILNWLHIKWMRVFSSFTNFTGTLKKSTPRIAIKHFTVSAQNNKYQPPKFKQIQDPIMATTTLKGQPFDRQVLDSMLRRRMFYTPSFEIYGGTAGLYDYGPVSRTLLPPSSTMMKPGGLFLRTSDAKHTT